MKKVLKKDLVTSIRKEIKEKTCTFYCRGVKISNKKFALEEAKRLGFPTVGRYIDAMIDSRKGAK